MKEKGVPKKHAIAISGNRYKKLSIIDFKMYFTGFILKRGSKIQNTNEDL